MNISAGINPQGGVGCIPAVDAMTSLPLLLPNMDN